MTLGTRSTTNQSCERRRESRIVGADDRDQISILERFSSHDRGEADR